jgi:hypothetical protein
MENQKKINNKISEENNEGISVASSFRNLEIIF